MRESFLYAVGLILMDHVYVVNSTMYMLILEDIWSVLACTDKISLSLGLHYLLYVAHEFSVHDARSILPDGDHVEVGLEI